MTDVRELIDAACEFSGLTESELCSAVLAEDSLPQDFGVSEDDLERLHQWATENIAAASEFYLDTTEER